MSLCARRHWATLKASKNPPKITTNPKKEEDTHATARAHAWSYAEPLPSRPYGCQDVMMCRAQTEVWLWPTCGGSKDGARASAGTATSRKILAKAYTRPCVLSQVLSCMRAICGAAKCGRGRTGRHLGHDERRGVQPEVAADVAPTAHGGPQQQRGRVKRPRGAHDGARPHCDAHPRRAADAAAPR